MKIEAYECAKNALKQTATGVASWPSPSKLHYMVTWSGARHAWISRPTIKSRFACKLAPAEESTRQRDPTRCWHAWKLRPTISTHASTRLGNHVVYFPWQGPLCRPILTKLLASISTHARTRLFNHVVDFPWRGPTCKSGNGFV